MSIKPIVAGKRISKTNNNILETHKESLIFFALDLNILLVNSSN